jgi:16S rRNA processing protein RimM
MPRPNDDAWIPLAAVGRPHGVRGELRVHPFNRDSALLLELEEVLVRFPAGGERAGEEHEVSIDGARRTTDAILLRLHGVDSRETAEATRGALLCARRGDFPAAEDGEFYACDVEGAEVVDATGAKVGVVKEMSSYPSVDIFVVVVEGGYLEVPIVDAFVETVDVAAGRVVLRTTEGLEKTSNR